MKPVKIKGEFQNVRPREITIHIGYPMNRTDIDAVFGTTKKGRWVLAVTWYDLIIEAACQQFDDDYGQYIYALLMRRVVRVYEACGIELPIIAARIEEHQ